MWTAISICIRCRASSTSCCSLLPPQRSVPSGLQGHPSSIGEAASQASDSSLEGLVLELSPPFQRSRQKSHLVDLLHHLKSGTTEVMLHPGMENETLQRDCAWEHDFKAEFSSITSIKIREIIDKNKIHLINFKDLFEDVL